jgi:hypothetical protein
MRCLIIMLSSPLLVAAIAWTAFAACLDAPLEASLPVARLVAGWDPFLCGEPHRVALELADEVGARVATSAPCNAGGLTLDVPQRGTYRGRIYASPPGTEIRAATAVEVVIDAPIVQWWVATPR